MLTPLTVLVFAVDAVLALLAAWYLWRDRLIDDRMLLVAGVLELALIAQLVVGLVLLGTAHRDVSGAIFVPYLFAVLIVAPFTCFLAIKEKSRWGMGLVLLGAFVVAILVGRLEQVWTLGS
ncbi:MAG TPA: hypothetical protein VFL99_15395 [Segeticoccus sp.]|uniref:hypothetical protein n=1 Tax=Segeticoccus sp. TaxID=2706531 RepID=UPI002D807EB0|nr:hypothetical protein [Segeticoccus sp.]HET8601712.1 hypothetical protein [Segeticoccus sp.]